MLAGELRYATIWLWVLAVILVPIGLVLGFGVGHASTTTLTGLAVLLIGAFGFVSVWLWLRFHSPVSTATPARYAPILFPSLILLFDAYLIANSVLALQAVHWRQGVDSFAILCFATLFLVVTTFQDWRRRYLHKPVTIPAFTQRRMKQFADAYALPAGPERQLALRPLLLRGYVRLGLIGFALVLSLALAPAIGTLAFLLSFAFVACIFSVLHWRFEL
jgi:hypothetical protein